MSPGGLRRKLTVSHLMLAALTLTVVAAYLVPVLVRLQTERYQQSLLNQRVWRRESSDATKRMG